MNQLSGKRSSWVRYGLPLAAVIIGTAVFLLTARSQGGFGFPLDDAWIHQTYARNLVRNGRLEFVPGVVSAGSTSPLWTLLLALGYLLRLPYLWWAYALGVGSLLWLAVGGMRLWRQLWPNLAEKDGMVGAVLALTWPFLWAAASGMETLFFAALGLATLTTFLSVVRGPQISIWRLAAVGVLVGLLILTRPDGVVLLVAILLGVAVLAGSVGQRLVWGGVVVGTAVLVLIPYFGFNLFSSGTIWPNTFYAKQTEYAALLAVSLVKRVVQLTFFSLGGPASGWRGISGAHLLLLPGLVAAVWQAVKSDLSQRKLLMLVPLLWAGGHLFLYAWRLPVTYQYGRYLLTAYPIWILYGLAGWQILLFSRAGSRSLWIMQQVGRWTFVGLLLFFVGLGSNAYADDVAFIEGEMVTMAKWIADNTPETALIASHDIGAIGYFGERPLLDLAGLISPEVIPLLDDDAALAAYILQSDAQYLVTAPGWPYQEIVKKAQIQQLFVTNHAWTIENGQNNMTIYLLWGS